MDVKSGRVEMGEKSLNLGDKINPATTDTVMDQDAMIEKIVEGVTERVLKRLGIERK